MLQRCYLAYPAAHQCGCSAVLPRIREPSQHQRHCHHAGRLPRIPFIPELVQALRPVPQWAGGVLPWLGPPLGDTWYDSMQVKVTKRYSHGLQAQGNFTWAKGLVNGASSDSTYFLNGNPATNDVYNLKQNKQLNQYVAPLAMTITATYTTPKFHATGFGMKTLSQVAGDWQIGTVLRYQSGALIQVPASNNGLGTELGRANQTFQNVVPGQGPLLVDPNCGCFNPQSAVVLNTAAWTDAAPGQWGASAPFYNNYRWQRHPAESMSFARNFRVGKEGRYSLQLRIEFQNIFNRLSLSAPTATNPSTAITTTTYAGQALNSGGFGSIATLNGARRSAAQRSGCYALYLLAQRRSAKVGQHRGAALTKPGPVLLCAGHVRTIPRDAFPQGVDALSGTRQSRQFLLDLRQQFRRTFGAHPAPGLFQKLPGLRGIVCAAIGLTQQDHYQ